MKKQIEKCQKQSKIHLKRTNIREIDAGSKAKRALTYGRKWVGGLNDFLIDFYRLVWRAAGGGREGSMT